MQIDHPTLYIVTVTISFIACAWHVLDMGLGRHSVTCLPHIGRSGALCITVWVKVAQVYFSRDGVRAQDRTTS